MNTYIRSLALASMSAAAIALPAAGNAAEVYGKVIVAVENIDQETNTEDFWQVASYDSRFGVKGKLDTDVEGLDAIYNLEWAVDVSDESRTSDDHITARNQFIGLKGGFGEFIAGRVDTPLKRAQGKVDLFNDRDADIKFLMAGGEVRANNIFQYTSPKLGDAIAVSIMGIPGEETVDPPAPPGTDLQNGLADATSVSVTYGHDNLYLAFAADSDVNGADTDATRVVAHWATDAFGVGVLFQTSDFSATVDPLLESDDEEVTFVSAYYDLNDSTRLKVQTGTVDNYASIAGAEGDTTAFGVDFALGEKTVLGLLVASRNGGDGLITDDLSRDTIGANLEISFE